MQTWLHHAHLPPYHLITHISHPLSPHAHPYLTHTPSLLQWVEIQPAPPASSSAASTPRTASSPPYSLSLSLSLSLSQWFFSFFFPLLHSSLFSPWFMLESSAFMPMVPLQQPPPSSSLPPTYAHLTTLFLATMAAGATLLIPTSTLLCLCFSRSLGTGPELSPLLSIGYPAGRVATCRAGSTIPLSTDHKPDRYDERQGIEDAGVSLFGQELGGLVVFLLFLVHLGINFLRHMLLPIQKFKKKKLMV
uniref:PPM-type phosphatase domain-containing protein n=1 Tax=Vitis vinifera TaxID=29760 RepID=F6GVE1_VITVI